MRNPGLVLISKKLIQFLLITPIVVGCAVQTDVDRQVNIASSADKLAAITKLAKHGDWLAVRGIHDTDNFVSTLTNMPLSHAAIVDLEKGQVIEAEGVGIHTASIADFVAKSRRLLIIRPIWATSDQVASAAVIRARELVGKQYDYFGLVGINMKDRFYCTELAVSVYQPVKDKMLNPIPAVIAPGQLYHWGTIIYDSGPELGKPAAPK